MGTALRVMAAMVALSPSTVLADAPFFIPLGDLGGTVHMSRPHALSLDGVVAVGRSYSPSGQEAFRWSEIEGMVGLGDLPGGDFCSTAWGVSGNGSTVVGHSRVGSTSGSDWEAFRWNEAGGMVGLGDFPGGVFSSSANAVSADGSVIAGYGSTESGLEAFHWTEAEGMVGLGDLPGGDCYSRAQAISADGSVLAGRSTSASGDEAFRWTEAEGMVGLDDLSGGDFFSDAYAMSPDGTIIVGRSRSGSGMEAFRWTEAEGMVGLGDLPGGDFGSVANAVCADGSTIVGYGTTDELWSYATFVWDETNGMRDLQEVLETDYELDLTGWHLQWATGISADGLTIAGSGYNPDGHEEAFIARIPEPASLSLLALGGLLVAKRRR